MKQHTINSPVIFKGVGLHSGKDVVVTVKPAAANEGISFRRIDLSNAPSIQVTPLNVIMDENISRCTAIRANGASVFTVEHLLAALHGAGIDNAVIEVNGEEVPGLDGSSQEFLSAFLKVGTLTQEAPRKFWNVTKPITVSKGDATLTILPADDFKVSYTLDYQHPALPLQTFETNVTRESFEKGIAPARTFCLKEEIDLIRAKGLGKGANERNTLVMTKDGPVGNYLRFPDECARHKALDIVGDLFLLGGPVKGHVKGAKSGHSLNRLLALKIMEQHMSAKVYDVNAIMKVLPHRYPFLLIDRVTVTHPGKKGVGLKNLTINDGFFAGHFPERPVMPGVLMVEALAQTAGVVVLTSGAHPDKVALFMSIDGVKFRKVVSPGDQLILEVEIIRDRDRTALVKGVGKVDGEIVVEAEMMFSYTEKKYLTQ